MQATGSGENRPIPRRSHTKSKTGCRTCKARKIKCDERRPLCENCRRHFTNLVSCDFDDQDPVIDPNVAPAAATTAQRSVAGPSSRAGARRPSPVSEQAVVTRNSPVGREAEPLQLPQAPSAGRVDPFEARPLSQEAGPTVDQLMHHYLVNFAYRSFPFYASKPLIELWWPFVRGDEVLFNVILLLSGLDREHLQSYHSIHTRQLLDQCLTLLNSRVQDPVAGTNDYTLVAIATLASMEHDRGNMRALDMHLEGLKRVVELRGGLDAIRTTNPMAANLVFWCAMVSVNEPSMLPLTYGDGDREMDWLDDPETATLLTHDGGQANLRDYGVDIATANILHEVQRLSKLYTSTLTYSSAQEAVHVLSQLCSSLERMLQMSKLPSDDSPIPGLSQSCRLAGCLHVFTPMSGYFPDPTLMLHTLVRDLKASLTYMIRAVGTKSPLLLWLLSVGGITAHSMPERSWFVGHLVVAITDLNIQSWETMRQSLVQLAFHDNFCDMSFHSLWDEVRAKQEALSLDSPSAHEPQTMQWCGERLSRNP